VSHIIKVKQKPVNTCKCFVYSKILLTSLATLSHNFFVNILMVDFGF